MGFQPIASWAEISPWLFCITIDEKAYGMSRDALMAHLADQAIETRPFFYPVHRLPPYATASSPHLPETDRLAAAGINLPTYHALASSDLDRICDAIRRARR